MFGNLPPFFFAYGPATANGPGILTGPGSIQYIGGQKTIVGVTAFAVRSTASANGTAYGIEFSTGSNTPRFDFVVNGVYTGQIGCSGNDLNLKNSKSGGNITLQPNNGGATFTASSTVSDSAVTSRTTGDTIPASGAGVEIHYSTAGYVLAYDRTAAGWKNLNLQGTIVTLAASGTTTFTAAAANNTNTVPLVYMSCTLGTVPSASANPRGNVYITDLAGGAEPCFSDGTNWRVYSTRAIAA